MMRMVVMVRTTMGRVRAPAALLARPIRTHRPPSSLRICQIINSVLLLTGNHCCEAEIFFIVLYCADTEL